MKTISFRSPSGLLDAAISELTRFFTEDGPSFQAVMLPGGTTPLPVYRALAAAPPTAHTTARIVLSDERMVPYHSPESNFAQIQPMAEALGITGERLLRVPTDCTPEDAAAAYHRALECFLAQGGRIPLGFLGLGADGHTASLFSADDVARSGARLAVAVPRSAGPHRVSVTPELLRHVARIVFLVSGRNKQSAVENLLHHPEAIPAGQATAGHPGIELWVSAD